MSEGIEVNHNLKSLCTAYLLLSKPSRILSNSGINDGAKWQFYNKIHYPS